MRILYVACGFDGGRSGVSVYMRETLTRLAERHEVTVVLTQNALPFFRDFATVRLRVLPQWMNPPLFQMLYVLLFLNLRFRKRQFDFLLLPAANRRAPWFRKWFTVAVVHDLSQYHIPAKYDPLRTFYIKHLLPFAVRRADRVFAVSASTREDLIRYWRLRPDQVEVNYNGFDRQRFHADIPRSEIARVRDKYELRRPYILYVSRIEHPGKNHLRLIQAYEALPAELKAAYDLVLGGSPWSRADVVFNHIETSLDRDHIRLIGFVSNGDLPALYCGCRCYMFPSLYEGFGLSIPEAIASGAVVACSGNSSLGEVAGDAALQFDPESVPEIRAALLRLLTDELLRAGLHVRGEARLRLFDWDRHVRRLEEAGQECNPARRKLLGVEFDNVAMPEALAMLEHALTGGERRKAAFINADCLNKSFTDPNYRAILRRCDPIFPDGSGVALGVRLRGGQLRGNVNGTDMLPELVELAIRHQASIFLLGARPGVAAQMRERLSTRYPLLRCVGTLDGYRGEPEMAEAVRQAEPDILLVALGAPRQEAFIDAHWAEWSCKLALGVGGLFDFYSGNMPRAPRLLRRLGLEWVFRLAMEPRRMFRRYVLGNPLFVFRVWRYGEDVKND